MRTCAVLPVKRFDDAKQRLDRTLNAGTRRALAEAMV
jgi:2-phospho-L-lactate guanylyltransferase (CobY/MobA/RfbA family)